MVDCAFPLRELSLIIVKSAGKLEIIQRWQQETAMNRNNIILSLTSFSMGSFLLFHFAMIWALGRFYIYESNVIVLFLETLLIVVILLFSLYCFLNGLRKTKSRNDDKK